MTNTLRSRVDDNEARSRDVRIKPPDSGWVEEPVVARPHRPDKAEQPGLSPVHPDEHHHGRERLFMWLLAAAILFGVLVLVTSTVTPPPVPVWPARSVTTHFATTKPPASAGPHFNPLSPARSLPSQRTSVSLPLQIDPLPLITNGAPVRYRHSSAATRATEGKR